MRVWSLKQTSGKIHLNNFQTIVFNQFRCKNTQPSKMTQKFVFIKVTHMLENYVRALTGPLFFFTCDIAHIRQEFQASPGLFNPLSIN